MLTEVHGDRMWLTYHVGHDSYDIYTTPRSRVCVCDSTRLMSLVLGVALAACSLSVIIVCPCEGEAYTCNCDTNMRINILGHEQGNVELLQRRPKPPPCFSVSRPALCCRYPGSSRRGGRLTWAAAGFAIDIRTRRTGRPHMSG